MSNHAYGMHVKFTSMEVMDFYLVKLSKGDKGIKIDETISIKDSNDLQLLVESKYPISLIITGKGISSKKITCKDSDGFDVLLNKALPNAKLDDFILERSSIDADHSIVSIIRNDIFLMILEHLSNLGISNFSSINIGPLVLNNLIPLVINELENGKLLIPNYEFEIENNAIFNLNSNTEPSANTFNIGSEKVFDYSLLPIAASLDYFFPNQDIHSNSDQINTIKSEFKEKENFIFRSWTLLGSALIILLINFFVFNYYWQENNNMQGRIQANESAINKLTSLKNEYANKMEFITANGLLQNSKTSFFSDQLALDLSESIGLSNLQVYPPKVTKDSYELEIPEFDTKKIYVKGICTKSIELNFWIKKIQKYKWVKMVQLINYTQESTSEKAKFFIEIVLN